MENQTVTTESNKVAERKPGKASTLKSWKTLVINLSGSGLLNSKDLQIIKDLYSKAIKQYMGEELL